MATATTGRSSTAAHNGASTSFQLTISINNADTNQPVSFKQDGRRIETSVRTLKLFADTKYKCQIKCRPPVEFHLHLGGSDLELISEHLHTAPGEYTAVWNTVGMVASKKGARNDILLILTGPGGSLRRKIQTKFYALGDSHGDWGSKMGSLMWTCQVDPTGGDITITDEQIF